MILLDYSIIDRLWVVGCGWVVVVVVVPNTSPLLGQVFSFMEKEEHRRNEPWKQRNPFEGRSTSQSPSNLLKEAKRHDFFMVPPTVGNLKLFVFHL